MFPSVSEQIINGTSGVNPAAANEGIVLFIGVAAGGSTAAGQTSLLGRSSAPRAILGHGPLTERIEDYFGAGGQNTQAIAIPLAATTGGACGAVTKTGTGAAAGAAAVKAPATKALCAADVIVEILAGGNFGAATFRVSVDGGLSWSAEKKTVASGTLHDINYRAGVAETGVTIAFTDAAPGAGSFVAGDTYKFTISEPDVTASDMMAALNAALLVYSPEMIAIVGASGSAEWATVALLASDQWNAHKPVRIAMEYALPAAAQTLDQWVAAALADGLTFASDFTAICAAFGGISAPDGTKKTRNALGVAMGFYSRLRVNESIGRYLDCPVAQVALPAGYTNAHAQQLDTAGYIALMKHAGSKVPHFANGRLKSQDGSDFQYIEDGRTVDKAARICRIEMLKSLHMPASSTQVNKLVADMNGGMGIMKRAVPPEIHNAIITVPPDQDVVNNGLTVELTVVKYGNLRKLTVRLAQTFFNPTAK